MNQTKLSICKYPLTTILVDDSETFLSQINFNLNRQSIICCPFTEPSAALNYLYNEYVSDPFTNRCISTFSDRDTDTFDLRFDFRKIHHEIYNPHRFSQVGVLTVDYAMPTMNGLEFCSRVNDELCQKILLTGEAGSSLVIDAFNADNIDKYLQKGNQDLPTLLSQSIKDLQYKYFLKLSDAALNKINDHLYKHAPSCLSDPIFISFFNNLCISNNIIEYYLLDENGSFLFLDNHGKIKWFIVKSKEVMENLYHYAIDQESPVEIINYLKSGNKVPYFHTDEDLDTPFSEAHKYFHDANVLEAGTKYYYAFISDTGLYHLGNQKIVTYAEYLQNN